MIISGDLEYVVRRDLLSSILLTRGYAKRRNELLWEQRHTAESHQRESARNLKAKTPLSSGGSKETSMVKNQ